MINTLAHYVDRSFAHVSGNFATKPFLVEKVAEDGSLKPFWGNTVVFDLDAQTKEQLARIQKRLYEAAGQMLAEELTAETFHTTLHDLVNGPGSFPVENGDLDRAAAGARSLIRQWRGQEPLQMRGTWTFNMDHTSICLGLEPVGDSWQRLADMYDQLQKVVCLNYSLCPHITLAYFKPGIYTPDVWQALRDQMCHEPISVTLSMENLLLKTFTDMNHYRTVSLKYQRGFHRGLHGDLRTAIKVTEGTGYILHIDQGLGGLDIDEVHADGTRWEQELEIIDLEHETESCWLEGCDEFVGIFETKEEAIEARDAM